MLNFTNQKDDEKDKFYEVRLNFQSNNILSHNYVVIRKFKNKNVITREELETMFIRDLEVLKSYQIYFNFKHFINIQLEEDILNNFFVEILSENRIININGISDVTDKMEKYIVFFFLYIGLMIGLYFLDLNFDFVIFHHDEKKSLFDQNKSMKNNFLYMIFTSINFILYAIAFFIFLCMSHLKFIKAEISYMIIYFIKANLKILYFISFFDNIQSYYQADFFSNLYIGIVYTLSSFYIVLSNYLDISQINNIGYTLISLIFIMLIYFSLLIDNINVYKEDKSIHRPYDFFALIFILLGIGTTIYHLYDTQFNVLIYAVFLNMTYNLLKIFYTIFQYNFFKLTVTLEFIEFLSNIIFSIFIASFFLKKLALLPKLLEIKKIVLEKRIDFIGYLFHELKTPLMNIKTKSDMIMEKFHENDEEKEELIPDMMSSIINSTKILKTLVGDFLTFSKNKFINVTNELINTQEFYMQVQEMVTNLNKEFKIILESDMDEFYGDMVKIMEIATNFTTNAIKYSGKNYATLIIKDMDNDYIYIGIKDDGAGIGYKKLKNLITPFARDSTIAENFSNGLGLYISKEFIIHMEGTFYIKTDINDGAEFGFYTKFSKNITNEEFIIDMEAIDEKENKKIIFYDDDKIIRDIVTIFLKKFNVTVATSEEELIKLLRTHKYDLLVVDYFLQNKIIGTDMIKIFKEENPDKKSLLISGYDNLLLVENEIIDGVLIKPFNKNQLIHQILKLL